MYIIYMHACYILNRVFTDVIKPEILNQNMKMPVRLSPESKMRSFGEML